MLYIGLFQFSSFTQLRPTLRDPIDCSMAGFSVHHQFLELTQTHVHRISDAIQPSDPLLLLPTIPPSIRDFSDESVLPIIWPKYWSFSLSISLSNKYSVLISFRLDCWISLQPKDSQESSPTKQFKNINSSVLSFLYSPTLTSIHDYWKINWISNPLAQGLPWWSSDYNSVLPMQKRSNPWSGN